MPYGKISVFWYSLAVSEVENAGKTGGDYNLLYSCENGTGVMCRFREGLLCIRKKEMMSRG